jgi:hypothetical protein
MCGGQGPSRTVEPRRKKNPETKSRGSSVSIVSDYGLDDRSSIPDRGRGFFLYPLRPDRLWGPTQPPVQWVPEDISPGVKSGRGVMLTTHPHPVPRLRICRSSPVSHPKRLHGVWRDHFLFQTLHEDLVS